MSQELLNQALAFFPTQKTLDSFFWERQMGALCLYLSQRTEHERMSMFQVAQDQEFQYKLTGFSPYCVRFFLHPSFEVFEEFWRDENLQLLFAGYLRALRRCVCGFGLARKNPFAKLSRHLNKGQAQLLVKWYTELLARHYVHFRSGPGATLVLMAQEPIVSEESARRIFAQQEAMACTEAREACKVQLQSDLDLGREYAELLGTSGPVMCEHRCFEGDDLVASLEVENFVLGTPTEIQSIRSIRGNISKILVSGDWPSFVIEKDLLEVSALGAKVRFTLNHQLFSEVRGSCMGELQRFKTLHCGRLPIGLKIHCLKGRVSVGRKGAFVAHNAEMSINLPPVGSVGAAVELLESVGKSGGVRILNNPDFQIQVCSPIRLSSLGAAILGVAFYLGSDQLRRYSQSDFVTSHSAVTDDRLIIYGAGVMNGNFEWWGKEKNGQLRRELRLPWRMRGDRTDVLSCQSVRDIDNVNLVTTLLVHAELGGYWEELGKQFIGEIQELLARHQLSALLTVDWVKVTLYQKESLKRKQIFFDELGKLCDYAFEEAARVQQAREQGRLKESRNGILFEMQDLLDQYRLEIEFRASQLE